MNLPAVRLASAYAQLTPPERVVVDAVVRHFEDIADRTFRRISLALDEPIPAKLVEKSNGLLERERVQYAITERIMQIERDNELNPGRVLRELERIAFSNIADFLDMSTDPPQWDFSKAQYKHWAAVTKFETEGVFGEQIDEEVLMGGRAKPPKVRVEMKAGKLDALKQIMLYMGMTKDENGHWQHNQPPREGGTIAGNASPEQMADEYQRLLESGG